MSTIDFNQLKLLAIFSTVVETGSFAAAARKLHTSRSRVSEQVALLEQQLNSRLLQRSTRQLTLTTEGQLVYEQARQLPQTLDSVHASLTPSEPSGRVKLTLNHDIAHRFVLPKLAEFQQHYPKVHLDLILDDNKLDLIQQQIDLAIRIGLPKDDSVIARLLHQEPMAIFASPGYLQNTHTPKTLEQLADLHWLLLTQASQDPAMGLRQDSQYIQLRPKSYSSCNSPLMLQQMVLAGLGVGMMLPTTVKQEIQQGKLIQLMPGIETEALLFSLVYPSRRQLPKRTRVVIDYLLQAKLFE